MTRQLSLTTHTYLPPLTNYQPPDCLSPLTTYHSWLHCQTLTLHQLLPPTTILTHFCVVLFANNKKQEINPVKLQPPPPQPQPQPQQSQYSAAQLAYLAAQQEQGPGLTHCTLHSAPYHDATLSPNMTSL